MVAKGQNLEEKRPRGELTDGVLDIVSGTLSQAWKIASTREELGNLGQVP